MRKSHVEGEVFFDSHDSIRTSVDSISSYFSLDEECGTNPMFLDPQFWSNDTMSLSERRDHFFRMMGFDEFASSHSECSLDQIELLTDSSPEHVELNILTESSDAAFDSFSTIDDRGDGESFCCIRDLDSGRKFTVHESGENGLSCGQVFPERRKKLKSMWRKLNSKRSTTGLCKNDVFVKNCQIHRAMTTKVRQHRKKYRELTALFIGQEIQAHNSLIRTIKFSPSGWYIASGGEDCIVCIWQIRELESFCKYSLASNVTDNVMSGKYVLGGKGVNSAPSVLSFFIQLSRFASSF